MNLTQLLQIVRSRRHLMIAIWASILVLAACASFLVPKTYVAGVSLIVDAKGTDPVSGVVVPLQSIPSYLATEVNVISSHNVALKVVDNLKLAERDDLQALFQDQGGGAGSLRDWIADRLLKQLTVKPAREGSVINLELGDADPQGAADLANAFAAAYIQTSLELKVDPAKRQATWFQGQVQGLRRDLEAAQQRQSDFQRSKGIAGADNRLDVENARLSEISSQLVVAQTAAADAQSKLRQMSQATQKQQVEQLPDLLGNALLQNMKSDLVRAEARLGEIAQRYDRNHPQYRSAAAEVEALRSRLTAEIDTVTGSVRQAAEMAQQRTVSSLRSLEQQKTRILELKQQRDDLAVLGRDVENAQRTYDAAIQRAEALKLQGQFDQSTIAILNPAVVPMRPARPRPLLNMLGALVLGGLLAMGAALGAELLDRRVRSADDVSLATRLMVLGEIPRLSLAAA